MFYIIYIHVYQLQEINQKLSIAGIEQEGLFRISGNKSVMEKLKASFEKTGTADLEETADVLSAAGLLKMFLRELPDSVIPDNLTRQFINVQDGK